MRRSSSLLLAAGLAGCVAFFARPAAADPFAYIYGSDAIPYHYAWRSDGAPAGSSSSSTETKRSSPFGLDSLAFGLGIGYTGLNAQLDVHNAANLWTGAATIGIREKLSLGPVEIWGRIGAGPGLVFDRSPTNVRTTGAIATDAEAGINWFFVPHVALGLKAVGAPQYSFPSTLSVDFGFALELRVTI